jgi:peptide deformylase
MTRLTILEYPDPRLRQRAEPVEVVDDSVRTLLDDLAQTLREAGGIGLAATQVNVHRRVVVVDLSAQKDTPLDLVNPEVIERSINGRCEESCLSLPGVVDNVARHLKVRVRALDRQGHPFEHLAEGLEAVCIQHEIDHLNGQLFIDRLSLFKRLKFRFSRPAPRPQASA